MKKQIMIALLLSGCSSPQIYCMKQTLAKDIAELKQVVVDVQKTGAVPKIIADVKDIAIQIKPIIQILRQDLGGKNGTTTPVATTTSTATTSTMGTTTTAPVRHSLGDGGTSTMPVTTETGGTSVTVPAAVTTATTTLTTTTDRSATKGKEKDDAAKLGTEQPTSTPTTAPLSASTVAATAEKFSEDDVWALAQELNPAVYEFGKTHQVSAHDLIIFVHLMQQYHFAPEAIVGFIHEQHELEGKQAHAEVVDKYTSMQQSSPDTYQMLGLGIIKALFDQADGKQQTSFLSNTHMDVLHDQITEHQTTIADQQSTIGDQQSSIRNRTIALIASVIAWIAPIIWGAITQAKSNGSGLNGTVAG